MAIIDQQREENYQEYLRLLCDSDYNDVTFDEKSGGVSAVHILHHFDKQTGPFGTRRGDYEIAVVSMLRNKGYRILLLPEECKTTHLKSCDCLLNDCQAEIKTVEGDGHWAVRTKIYDSIKQGAEILILYFPQTQLFSIDRITEGWQMNDDYIREYQPTMRPISRIIAVVGSSVLDITKPSG